MCNLKASSAFASIPVSSFLLTLLIVAMPIRPAAANNVIQVEAEDLDLTSYEIENHAFTSNGKVISLLGPSGSTGSGSGRFTGDEGDYTIVINYLDEEDGEGLLAFEANGVTIENWTLDQRLGANQPEPNALTARTFGPVHLKRGDVFNILANKSGDESVSVDLIQFIPVTDIYQAEEAALSPEAVIKTDQPGSTGAGYVETSGEGSIEWTVNASVPANAPASAADHSLEFRYAYGYFAPVPLPLAVFVNNELVVTGLPFKDTGAPSRWLSQTQVVRLKDGPNTIRIQTRDLTEPTGFMANIDYVSVTKVDYLNALGSTTPRPDVDRPESTEPEYTGSYYGCVDPAGERTSLTAWKERNGFNESNTVSANYINAFDLGFGRKMTCLKDSSRTACYVDNYLDPKGKQTFAATVAMERMEPSETCSDKSIIAFYVYAPDGRRINQLELDSEGSKSVPESCYGCHGGENENGIPSDGAKFLAWNIDLFEEFPGEPSLEAQTENFRELNDIVWGDVDRFDGPRIKSMIESWYGGRPMGGTVFNNKELFVETEDQKRVPKDVNKIDWFSDPKGHLPSANPETRNQNNHEGSLYTHVYAKYCRACHTALRSDWSTASGFGSSAYERICDKSNAGAVMPHAELTDDLFKNEELIVENGGNRSSTTAFNLLCGQEPTSVQSDQSGPGRGIFRAECSQCHRSENEAWQGVSSTGSDKSCRGSSLTRTTPNADGTLDLASLNPEMSGIQLDAQEVNDLNAYLNSFDRCKASSSGDSSGGSFGFLTLILVAFVRNFRSKDSDR